MSHFIDRTAVAARVLALAGLLAAPASAPALADGAQASALFGGAPLVEADTLATARGTQNTTITGDVGVNLSDQRGTIAGNAITAPTVNGALGGNSVSDNRGLTISNFNTGNFNTFQTSVQYNIFLD
ncbi:hypothetical protein C882_1661 [Caenispirillum salinarum AK4]|uniref:Uncharacterized protein n=1 Tax=Caenispirillum salinarum AK4 TaxID=1238182 RepID=K9HRB1_9PROT|nr:hypothetical protein [Caenispirillum salinarum]EKV32823.1 hypothetical protein C882_1661 [Caenispirillum salinarum AK4]